MSEEAEKKEHILEAKEKGDTEMEMEGQSRKDFDYLGPKHVGGCKAFIEQRELT